MSSILFILKRREDYNAVKHSSIGLSTGLYNSASFVDEVLNHIGLKSNLVVVKDNNDIDREVIKYNPTYVIIEALWVVPSKFYQLQKLHPTVKWIIRLHSEMPFMAGEGMAMDWIGDYSCCKNIIIACNTPRMLKEIKTFLQIKNNWNEKQTDERVVYLPNYYPQNYKPVRYIDYKNEYVNVGCFGAIRLLKNHLIQAHAAIDFANRIGKKLHFHINSGRIEMKGEPALNNLKGLFQHMQPRGYELINHEWTPREQFLVLCSQMDIGLQVSFSETFNIVGADYISQGVPIIGSTEIPWLASECGYNVCFPANPTDSKDIADKMIVAYNNPKINVEQAQTALTKYTNDTEAVWRKYFN
jgi:hypothetical protein